MIEPGLIPARLGRAIAGALCQAPDRWIPVFRSFSMGTIAGIDIRIHPSVVFGALWIAYEFGVRSHDGVGGSIYGVTLLVLVMGCVVLHELGHSFMAREYGSGIRDITIYPLGGAAYIERMPSDPRSEAAVTIAGPMVNLAIAACLTPIVIAVGLISGLSTVNGFLNETTRPGIMGLLVSVLLFNLVNILFNLIPAFPMDGGRLVRAGLSTIIGRERATSIAVAFGFLIAICMIVVGVMTIEPTLPLIGIFVMYLAYVEGKAVRIEAIMRRMRVGQFALWDGGGVGPGEPLTLALGGGIRDMAVTSEGKVVGMLWRADVVQALRQGAANWKVADVVDPNAFTAPISASVLKVHQLMEETNRWAVPITEGETYRGIFTADRLMHVYKLASDQTSMRRRLNGLYRQLLARVRQEFGSA